MSPFQRSQHIVSRFGVLLLFLLLFRNCSFRSPQEPTFIVDWFLPLVEHTWTMSELTDDVKELEVDAKSDRMLLTYRNDLSLAFDEQLLRINLEAGNGSSRSYPSNVETIDSLLVSTIGFVLQEPSVIDRGTVEFFFTNSSHSQKITTRLVLLDLLEPDGVTHPVLNIAVPPAAAGQSTNSVRASIDLKNYHLDPAEHGGHNFFRFAVMPQGPVADFTGGVGLSTSRRSFILREITGKFDRLRASFSDVKIQDPIPEELQDIRFQSVELMIPLYATVCVPLNLFLFINAENPRNDPASPVSISKSYNPIPCRPDLIDTLKIYNAAALFNSNPERLSISGMVEIGDSNSQITIGIHDSLFAQAIFRAPLTIQLPIDTTLTEPDTLDIDSDTQELIRDHIEKLTIDAQIENHTPLAVTVTLLFSRTRSDKSIYDHPADLVVGPIQLPQPQLSGQPATVSKSATAAWQQNLSKAQMQWFADNDRIYLGTKIIYLGTASRMVQVRPSDYVRVDASLKASVSSNLPENK